jgi:hypothetical protein
MAALWLYQQISSACCRQLNHGGNGGAEGTQVSPRRFPADFPEYDIDAADNHDRADLATAYTFLATINPS